MKKVSKNLLTWLVSGAVGGAIGWAIASGHPHRLHDTPSLLRLTPAVLASVAILCIFSIYWSAVAKNSKPAESSESVGSRRLHLLVLNGGVLLLILSIPGLTRRFLPSNHLVDGIGLALEIAGFALAVWARRTLGSNWSGEVRIATGHQLVRSGPYQYIRHPIYTAVLCMYCGIMIVSGEIHAPIAVAIIILAYLRKIRLEETALAATFGDEFASWRRESWALVPLVF
jgi:protein-S-isoprenylcysteine O-methyltransferase Ste14